MTPAFYAKMFVLLLLNPPKSPPRPHISLSALSDMQIGKGLGWGLYYLISTFSLAQGDLSLADTLAS